MEHTPLLGSVRTVRMDESRPDYASTKHYSMSSLPPSTFRTLTEELKTAQSTMEGDKNSQEQAERRTLYGSLPFVAAFGMQKRESTMKKVISSASMHTLAKMISDEEKQSFESIAMDVDEISITLHLILAVAIAIISQFLVGYNTSVMNLPESIVFAGHSTLMWSLAVAALAVGGPFGSMLGGVLANQHGRRGTMIMNSWIFLSGGLLMCLAPNIYLLTLGRLVIGIACGIAMVVVPVYLGEIAPPTLRGTLGTCTQFAIVIGILASNCAVLFVKTNWRGLFAVIPALSILQLFSSSYLVESPRWLLNKNLTTEARVVIQKLRAFRHENEIDAEIAHYLFAAAKHKTARTSAHSAGAIWDLLNAKDVRILLVSSLVLQVAQQLSGINAVFYYSTSFFAGIIPNPQIGTIAISVVNLLATIAALNLMDNTPRRQLLLWSSGGMIASMIAITASLQGFLPAFCTFFALLLFVISFAIGLGPIPWLIVAEMFDAKYVATAMSLTCVINWLCNFLVGLSFPFFNAYLHQWCFVPFCIVLTATTVFIYFYLPETQGRSVGEVYKLVTAGRIRTSTLQDLEEKMVEMPVIDAVELLESAEQFPGNV